MRQLTLQGMSAACGKQAVMLGGLNFSHVLVGSAFQEASDTAEISSLSS